MILHVYIQINMVNVTKGLQGIQIYVVRVFKVVTRLADLSPCGIYNYMF